MKRLHIVPAWGLLIPIALVLSGCRSEQRLGTEQHVVDTAGLLKSEDIPRMDRLYQHLLRDTDVDFVVVSIPTLQGKTISDHANKLFQRWKLGGRTRANRGVLLLVSTGDKLVRLHTSYEMESLLTDAFISYVEHQMMVPYFEKNQPGPGLEATAELVARRIYEKILNKSFDPSQAGPADIGGYQAGGGGVENPVPLGASGASAPSVALPVQEAAQFLAQPSPSHAWEAFLRWNSQHIKDTAVGLFDAKTQQLFAGTPNPTASQDHITQLYSGKAYEVRQEGDLAAIVFPDDPAHLLAPWFLKRFPDGWKLNGEMYPEAIVYDHLNRWGFRTDKHSYHFAFKDYDIRPGYMAKRRNAGPPRAYVGLNYYWDGRAGVPISSITPGGPADKAGLEPGDLLLSVNNQAVAHMRDFERVMRGVLPGETIRVKLIRGSLDGPVTIRPDESQPFTVTPKTTGLRPPRQLELSLQTAERP